MNRNQLSLGLIIFAVFIILVISGSIVLFKEWKNSPAQIGQRGPLADLGYCTTNQTKPCVLSFNMDPGGKMLINILTDTSSPDFYLKIKSSQTENIYACQKTKGFAEAMTCSGEVALLGATFQFLIISSREDTLLAEGRFPIIGLALATPEIYSTPTSAPPLRRY